jgi:CheY-like chemotaxis protein
MSRNRLVSAAVPRALRVLVVDDNRDAADSLATLVTIWGHDARAVYDGATALVLAAVRPPDVILLDIGMPTMDGVRLAGLLRRQPRLAGTLLVAITGWADKAHRRLWEGAFDHYLVKPVDPTTVERLLLRKCRRLAMFATEVGGTTGSIAVPAAGLDLLAEAPPDVRSARTGQTSEGLPMWVIMQTGYRKADGSVYGYGTSHDSATRKLTAVCRTGAGATKWLHRLERWAADGVGQDDPAALIPTYEALTVTDLGGLEPASCVGSAYYRNHGRVAALRSMVLSVRESHAAMRWESRRRQQAGAGPGVEPSPRRQVPRAETETGYTAAAE